MTLRKGLQRLEGVAQAKLILRPPHLEVKVKAGHWPDPRRMWEVIRDAGYTPVPEETELRVRGTLSREADHLTLQLDGMRHPVELRLTAAEPGSQLVPELEKRVGQVVELEGRWKPGTEEGSHGELAVKAVLPTGERKER